MDRLFIVTNNPQVSGRYRQFAVENIDGPALAVLTRARDHVHRGHRLLTHPLSGSIRPGGTPCKTILLSRARGILDQFSLDLIEKSIEAYCKTGPFPAGREGGNILHDYEAVDLSLAEAALSAIVK